MRFVQRPDDVPVGAGDELVQQLDDRDLARRARRRRVAISRPMMPPPMTSRRFGTSPSSSAPVESMTRGSSSGSPGCATAREPAAMMRGRTRRAVCAVGASRPRARCGDAKLPDAVDDLSPCAAWRGRRGRSVSLPTTPSFQPRSLSRSIFGLPNAMPWCAHLLRLGDHLGDMQQRLRRDAADVEADAAERRDSARPAPPSCRGRRRGRRRCSRPGRRPAPPPRHGCRRLRSRGGRLRPCGSLPVLSGCGGWRAVRASASATRHASSKRISEPSETLSPTLSLQRLDHAGVRTREFPSSPCRFPA